MLSINAPFLPDASYENFLKDLGPRLHSVYFSLYDPALCDARIRLRLSSPEILTAHLERLGNCKKYLLANGRFQPADVYHNGESLRRIIESLKRLVAAGVLDGIVFADSYLLTALADAAPEAAAQLEAVPSINFGIDSMDKVDVLIEMSAGSGFRMPEKIPLDRSLNRRPEKLAALSREIRRRWPAMKIELLVNEGCLPHCPFRSTHEALIAAANAGMRADTHRLNRELACIRILSRTPHRIFASPFIRPEETDRYAASADIIKVCGRTLGTGFLKRTLTAYAQGRYRGNLLDLLDAAHWMAGRWDIPNSELPAYIPDALDACHPPYAGCKTLFDRYARAKPLRLETLAESGGSSLTPP